MDTGEEEKIPKRVEGLFYRDGTIVLRCEKSKSLFRVYQGILERVSSVFHDMLANPQPDTGEFYEPGVPLVQMHDSGEDLEVFLNALFDPEYWKEDGSLSSISAAVSLLSMSTKYDVPHLRRRAISFLSLSFISIPPPTIAKNRFPGVGEATLPQPLIWEAFLVLKTATKCNVGKLLPTAYYSACYDMQGLVHGADGGILLDLPQQSVCLMAREKLLEFGAFEIESMTFGLETTCTRPGSCSVEKIQWASESARNTFKICDPLESQYDWVSAKQQLCGNCFIAGRKSYVEARRKLWDLLPSFFDLPPWEELLKSE